MSEARQTEILETVTLPSKKALGTVTWEQLYIREGWAFLYQDVETVATNYTLTVPAETGDVTRIIMEPIEIDGTSQIEVIENPTVGGTGGTTVPLRNLNRQLGEDVTNVTLQKGTTTEITLTGGTSLNTYESTKTSGSITGSFWYLKKGLTYGMKLSLGTTVTMLIYEIRGD